MFVEEVKEGPTPKADFFPTTQTCLNKRFSNISIAQHVVFQPRHPLDVSVRAWRLSHHNRTPPTRDRNNLGLHISP